MLNPPFLRKFSRPQRSPAVTKSGTLYYPIWLAYATGVLEKEGFNVQLIDAPADGYDVEYVLKRAEEFNPALVVIDTSTPSIYNDVEVGGKIKDIQPNAYVVLVGTHVSALPEESLQLSSKIDAIARHEYDYTIRDLAYAVASGASLCGVEGLSYKDNGKIIHNSNRPYIQNLDEMPFASEVIKRHLKIENYFNPNALYPAVTIITGRGCPNRCIFCVFPQTLHGRGYRRRSAENVANEFEYIESNFPNAKAVFIEDDTLTANRKRCRRISNLLIDKGIKISWTANARADVDYETLKIMKESGCRTLCVGFESGDQEILDRMRKGLTLSKARQFMENARKAGILVHGCFMVGNPGETRKTMLKTLNFAKELNPDTAQFYPVMVYPGTEAYEWAKENGYLTTHDYSQWITPEGLHNCVISLPGLSKEELVRFCDDARRSFYLRFGYLVKKLWQATHSEERRRIFKSAKVFIKHLMKGSISSSNDINSYTSI